MGASFTNLIVHSDNVERIAGILDRILDNSTAYVSPSAGGWTGVYPESTENQDEGSLRSIAVRLSAILGCSVFAFLMHDDDVFMYWLFDSGELMDKYNSTPDYFDFSGTMSKSEKEEWAGHPDIVARYCKQGTTAEEVEQSLRGKIHSSPRMSVPEMQKGFSQFQKITKSRLEELEISQPDIAEKLRTYMELFAEKLNRGEHPVEIDAWDVLNSLSALIGIRPSRVSMGYNAIVKRETDEDLSLYLRVPTEGTRWRQ